MSNKLANYYSVIGDYRGAFKQCGKWIGVREFNRRHDLKPKPLLRWQGPPSAAIEKALKNPTF